MYFNQIVIKSLLVLSNLVLLSFAQDEGPGFVFKCNKPGQVALTFDDGPSAENTPKLLETLKTKKVKATFFVLAIKVNEANGKAILKQTFDAGHQIALHSATHANMSTLTEAKIKEEYTTNIDAVKSSIGLSPNYARPPFGSCNAKCVNVMKELGLTVTQWNADSQDWQYAQIKAQQRLTVKNLVDIISKGNPKTDSFIALQHDIQPFSVDFTSEIIDSIAKLKYKFVTVAECLENKPPAYKEGAAKVNPTTAQQPTQPLVATSSSPLSPSSTTEPAKAKSTAKPTPSNSIKNNQNKSDVGSATNTAATATTATTTGTASSADKIVSSSILAVFSFVSIFGFLL